MTMRWPGRVGVLAGLTASQLWLVPESASAQSVFRLTPSFSTTEQHDSNVFATPVDSEADFVTRLTPAIESEYRSPVWTISAGYLLDIERFAAHRELDSMDARQHAGVVLSHRPAPRLAWGLEADVWKTRTPGELNQTTGLTLARAPARRLSLHPSVTRRFSAITTGTIDYTVSRDDLSGGAGATTHDVVAGLKRRRTPRDTFGLAYRFREFAFNPAGASMSSAAVSQAVTFGWEHAMTRRLRLSFDAGPRLTNSSPSAELIGAAQYQRGAADFALSYARTQATVIGLAGVADTQSLSATGSWTLWSSTRVRVGPSMFRSALDGMHADAYALTVAVTRPLSRGLLVEVALDSTGQQGSLYPHMANTTIGRRAALIRLIAGASPVTR